MADITFEEILQAAQKLSPQQKILLAQSLDVPPVDMEPTREELIAELDALVAAGAFEHVESLRNKYAKLTDD